MKAELQLSEKGRVIALTLSTPFGHLLLGYQL